MSIVVIGSELNLKEVENKFGAKHQYHFKKNGASAEYFAAGAVIFDFAARDTSIYAGQEDIIVFFNSTFSTLSQLAAGSNASNFFGFCGLQSFFEREYLELTVLMTSDVAKLEQTCSSLNTKYKIVEDRVGMVTPRIVCMIINEAYYAVESGVASRSDIDLAMKLGTSYPFGPFEWSQRIGLRNVYDLLKSVYESTKDERYKICKLLESEAITS
jgi:3-hydroxybutyryl-CoA dehydrogenase